jgi:putative radical SAM enzyme (TIGR03279 family)
VSLPRVIAVAPGSPAARAGLVEGDEILSLDGVQPRDVIEWHLLVDEPEVVLDVRRGGLERQVVVEKASGEPLGAEVDAAIFDEVQTCDNHCEFCFIYQLPPGMRRSLYLKDDDYRLSFLYGNFTTLTRFTEIDLERVVTEGLSPLYVSIHATDPEVRADLLRNRRGATSLRWLRALLDHGVAVHGQIVVCPGVNDGAILADTLAGVLDEYPELASLAVVPLGISDHSDEARMRPHTREEAETVVDIVEDWQDVYRTVLGRRLVFAADEYYLLAARPFPPAEAYEGFAMHEDGIGMARTFEAEFHGAVDEVTRPHAGFFAWVDGAPAEGYRAPRTTTGGCGTSEPIGPGVPSGGTSGPIGPGVPVRLGRRRPAPDAPVGVLTGPYGAQVLAPLLGGIDRDDVRLVEVPNRFFGGNIGVTGLMVGEDIARVLADQPAGHRYLLPDVCLSQDRFLDGMAVADLPRPVEVVPTDGASLRAALGVPLPASPTPA